MQCFRLLGDPINPKLTLLWADDLFEMVFPELQEANKNVQRCVDELIRLDPDRASEYERVICDVSRHLRQLSVLF